MLVKDIRSKLPIKTIPKIIGELTHKAINELRWALYANAAAIPPTLRRGGEISALAYSWTQKSMLMLLPLPTKDQQSQSYMHNMG